MAASPSARQLMDQKTATRVRSDPVEENEYAVSGSAPANGVVPTATPLPEPRQASTNADHPSLSQPEFLKVLSDFEPTAPGVMEAVVRSLEPRLCSSSNSSNDDRWRAYNKIRQQLTGLRDQLVEAFTVTSTKEVCKEVTWTMTCITLWAARCLCDRQLEDIFGGGTIGIRRSKEQHDAARQAISTVFELLTQAALGCILRTGKKLQLQYSREVEPGGEQKAQQFILVNDSPENAALSKDLSYLNEHLKFFKVSCFEGPVGNESYESFKRSAEKAIQKLPKKNGGVQQLSMGKTAIARELIAFMTGLGQALGLPGVPEKGARYRLQEPWQYSKLHWDAKHLDRTDPNSGTYWFRMCLRLPIARDTQVACGSPNYLLLEGGESELTEPRLYYVEFDSGFWVYTMSRELGHGKTGWEHGVISAQQSLVTLILDWMPPRPLQTTPDFIQSG